MEEIFAVRFALQPQKNVRVHFLLKNSVPKIVPSAICNHILGFLHRFNSALRQSSEAHVQEHLLMSRSSNLFAASRGLILRPSNPIDCIAVLRPPCGQSSLAIHGELPWLR